ncbi:deaminase-reductase domain-containing protein [Cercophora newfieldiana]|uniref:2,5-diamino-6-ribosylamino-4(3H)-pyrimidinone 5'-phosphate reductase n=1 Tax=Cercophora newfieldiana TaxID=92897 RepID=A0AA39YID8_9PEZI|nr:deaminase-reductase domain-containing protein [Cercophora newfieldiana]
MVMASPAPTPQCQRLVRYNVAATLDGFIASVDGSTDWIVEDPAIDFDALHAQFSTFIMGRKTYEAMLKYGNPLAGRPQEAVIVVSSTMKPEDHPAITIEAGDPRRRLRELKEGNGKDIWVMGGGQLVGPLLEAGLVDTIEVAIMPVVIGEGAPLLARLGHEAKGGYKLSLVEATTMESSGILMTRYKVLPRASGSEST